MDGELAVTESSESDPHPQSASFATNSNTKVVSKRESQSLTPGALPLDDPVLANLTKREHGRDINNFSDVYQLPADEEELDRLDKQHVFLVHLLGGKYVPPMAEVMGDDTQEAKAILDLGCGSGSWYALSYYLKQPLVELKERILDAARDFPHCQAFGVDLIPIQVPDMPPNLKSKIGDVNLCLDNDGYGEFDVVHARLISSGIKDYHRLIDQISHVLRPGGLIDISEFDFHYYDGNHNQIEHNLEKMESPWLSCWMAYLARAAKQSGGDIEAANHLHGWVSANPAFEDVVYREFFLPAIPNPRDHFKESVLEKRMHEALGEDVKTFIRASRPMLLNNGLAGDFVDTLITNSFEEMKEGKIPHFTRLQCVYARKKRD